MSLETLELDAVSLEMQVRELYQELIIEHGTKPRNHRILLKIDAKAEGFNPLCGDKIELFLTIEEDKIIEASFLGKGCAISQASASLMTEALMGKTVNEALQLFQQFKALVTHNDPEMNTDSDTNTFLGKLAAFKGVRSFPSRVKCATLAWHTLNAALKENPSLITTE